MRFPAAAVWFDAERRLEASAARGLDAELLSPFPALLNYRAPAEVGRDLARVTNEYIAGLVAAYPARFYGLGTVPMQDPDLAAAELTEVAKAGLAGVEIASNVNGAGLHEERFDGFWAEAERLGTAVFVHGMPVPSDRVPGPATATFGVGAEGALGAVSIVAGGVAEKYPGLKIAFSHAAGGFPLMLGRANWFWGRTWNGEPPLPESGAARGDAVVRRARPAGAGPPVLLRLAGHGPPGDPLPRRPARHRQAARRLGLPGDAARGPDREDPAVDGTFGW